VSDNVFNRLFSYRPKEDRSSYENYLTEAFAFTLKSCPAATASLVAYALETTVGDIQLDALEPTTQQAIRVEDGSERPRPDLTVAGRTNDGKRFKVWCEHKWDSPLDVGQLKKYRAAAASSEVRVVVMLITPRPQDRDTAVGEGFRVLLWENVHDELKLLAAKSDYVRQFVDFLRNQGLGPQEPFTLPCLAAYRQSYMIPWHFEEVSKALLAKKWPSLPRAFRAVVKKIDTKTTNLTGLQFVIGKCQPGLLAGLVLHPQLNHNVRDFSSTSGPDLMFAISIADKKRKVAEQVLAGGAERLRQAGLDVLTQDDPPLKNHAHKLIVCKPLAYVIRGHATRLEQVDAIYSELLGWGEVLFADGELEKAFRKTWPEAWKDK
jgi:hypothetical protein